MQTYNLETGTDICNYYLEKNQEWIPRSYANAAYCACNGDGDERWLSPSATCIRNYLLKKHKSMDE